MTASKELSMSGFGTKGVFKKTRLILIAIRDDRVIEIAGSLAFSSLLAIVPLLALALALFTAFPIFADFEAALRNFLVDQLMPESFSTTIMDYLNTFAQQSSKLSAIGGIFLVVTALLIVFSVESALNKLWHVQENRGFAERVFIFMVFILLGPLVAGASLWTSAYLVRESLGLVPTLSLQTHYLNSAINISLSTIACSWLFIVVPNCKVLWRHALIGGFFTAFCLEAIRLGLAYYLKQFPTYTVIYGTFSVLPAFLIWLFLSWVSFLSGATVAATLGKLKQMLLIAKHSKI
jgi:membrane protein